eukprot:scaffold8559_cov135-Skeletonema_marinoi.AAC.6
MPNATATNQSISADSSNTPVAGVLGEEEITSPPRGGCRKKMLSFEAKADFFVIDSTAATTPQLTSVEEDSDMKKTAEGSNLVVLALAAEMVAMTAKRLADKKSPPTTNKRKRAPSKKQPAKSIDWKKYRKVCSAPNCTNQANRKGGVCKRHGRLCSSPNCTNTIVNRGVCMKHGAIIKRCNTDGCDNFAIQGGVCITHGAKVNPRFCKAEGCRSKARNGGVCIKHGAKVKRCSYDGCKNQSQKGGLCKKHGADVKHYLCSIEGCQSHVVQGGVCRKHGAEVTYNPKSEVVQSGGLHESSRESRGLY